MTWTYSGDPSASTRDELRFLVGDTDADDPQITDEEIAYIVSKTSSAYQAAVQLAQALQARYVRMVDKSNGDLRISYSQRLQAIKDFIKSLRGRTTLIATPVAGGQSLSRKETVKEDSDRVAPAFARDQFRPEGWPVGGADDQEKPAYLDENYDT